MSVTLKRQAKKLLKISKASLGEIGKFLRSANRKVISALAEISLNVVEGVLKAKVAKRGLVKTLADKRQPFVKKQRALRSRIAPKTIKIIVTSASNILKSLAEHG